MSADPLFSSAFRRSQTAATVGNDFFDSLLGIEPLNKAEWENADSGTEKCVSLIEFCIGFCLSLATSPAFAKTATTNTLTISESLT